MKTTYIVFSTSAGGNCDR